nr:hypothetical protein [Kineococcus rubinsiae]
MSTDEVIPGGRQNLAAATYGQQLSRISFAGADLTSSSGPRHLRFDRCSFAGADLRQATLEQVSSRCAICATRTFARHRFAVHRSRPATCGEPICVVRTCSASRSVP